SLIEDYLHTELRIDQAKAISRTLVKQRRERNFILCYLGADSYAFVHRTFLEYFCAAEIVHQFNVAKTLSEQELIALFDTHCRDDDWREVLRLICGQIDEQFVGRIVEHLATRTDLENWDGQTPLPELPLAIWCLSEVRTLSRLGEVGSQLLECVIRFVTNANANATDRTLIQFMLSELVHATSDLGTFWPNRAAMETCAISQIDKLNEDGRFVWPLLVANVLGDAEPIRRMATWRSEEIYISSFRLAALQALAEKWPDETTRELLAQRAADPNLNEDERGDIREILGGMHSEFGRIVLTRDLDGVGPYLDPQQPVAREHIERAAKQVGIRPEEVDATAASLSEHLGWDITRGAKPDEKKTASKKATNKKTASKKKTSKKTKAKRRRR
ncbi:MAG: hypothetical protein O3B13_19980, partial [Planctomycetota bacterium]|nr:hypothetical protein [Planctomycetota bacterium]